jgi:hypothetical protein
MRVNASRRRSSIIIRATTEIQKILPPNFNNAVVNRHLAKDSTCAENSRLHHKNPNRSRVSKQPVGGETIVPINAF